MNLLDLVSHVKKLLLVIFSFSFSSVTKQKYTIYRKALLSCLNIPPKGKKKLIYDKPFPLLKLMHEVNL